MGAQQSTGQSEPSPGSAPTRTCYYELLAVERQATDEEIKKAYRRKALELHPDRNYNNVDEATQKFAEVQAAYEVLSDPQERAWYDSHRESILRGNEGPDGDGEPTTFRNVRLTPTEEIHNLMRRFNASVPFNDEPTGFFGITRETFEHLGLEEEAASDFDGTYCPDYPTFGSSDDDFEAVVKPFYAVWSGFSTRKSFAWKDKYRLSDAPDRQVRRLMEKENKKIRDDAIREFNDAVRFLVVFVRKRDPRYTPNIQTDSERQKALRNAAAAQAARARAANQDKMTSYTIADWAQSREDSGAEDHFPESEVETESEEVEVLECVVCDKKFKSENQLGAHQKSKKHVKAVQQLRWRMKKEGADLDLEGASSTMPHKVVSATTDTDDRSSNASVPQNYQEREKTDASDESLSAPTESRGMSAASSDTDERFDGDYAPRSVVRDRLAPELSKPVNTSGGDVDESDELSPMVEKTSLEDKTTRRKIGKAKAKRERKAAQSISQQPDAHRCTVCAEAFTSRSKLFQHIRDESHAAQVFQNSQTSKKGKIKR